MRHHAAHQCVRPAAREPDAAVALQFVDERVDRAGRHRIAADQQSMEGQGLTQFLALHEARDDRIDRAPRLIAGERGRGAQHRGEIEERHRAELLIALAINARRIIEELAIAGDVVRVQRRDLGVEARIVVRIIERAAIGPGQPVEGRHRHQLDIPRDVRAGQRPERLQAIGIGDDGRPGVEDMAVLLPEISPPAGLVARLDQCRRDPRRLQADGEREAAEAGADHRGGFAHAASAFKARPSGTGGLPLRMRALSAKVERPA